jgi:FkbM family methyltransferase
MEWKTRWPQCRVLCFEPDPFAFALLKKNIDSNGIPGVECVNAAVSDFDGTATLHGEISAAADARGNSIDAAWGKRSGSEQANVLCRRLSPYIAEREVCFLKLDIEGAEQRVLTDVADHLGQVQAIYVEVHETDASIQYNSQRQIAQLLRDADFQIDAEPRYDRHALPAHLDAWRRRVNARQTQLMGWRSPSQHDL